MNKQEALLVKKSQKNSIIFLKKWQKNEEKTDLRLQSDKPLVAKQKKSFIG